MWYRLLNYFFFGFHSILILFNTFGWIFRRTRKYNLATLLITGFSWFVLGIWYGWGYCFCTDWHWTVRQHLGYTDQTNSYIHFLILKLTGINFSLILVEQVTAAVFFISLVMSLWLNIRDRKRNVWPLKKMKGGISPPSG
jgi:hypothetical protein